MKRCISGFVAGLATLLFFALPALATNVGDKPELNFQTADGKTIKGADLKGHVVIIDFWATWNGPCMAEVPHMVKINDIYSKQGVIMLGISLDDNERSMVEVAQQKGLLWPQVFDGNGWKGPIAQGWGVTDLPNTFIIGPEGDVLWNNRPAQIDQPLAEIVKKYPYKPSSSETREQALGTINQAAKLVREQRDFEGAIKALEDLPTDLKPDAKLARPAKALQEKFTLARGTDESKAQAAIAAHKDAADKLKELAEYTPPTAAANSASGGSATATTSAAPTAASAGIDDAKLAARIDAKFKQAQTLEAAKNLLAAYDAYKWVADNGGDSDVAKAAQQKVQAWDADPAFKAQQAQAAAEQPANDELWFADTARQAGNKDAAKQHYNAVISQWPNSQAVLKAHKALTEMAGGG